MKENNNRLLLIEDEEGLVKTLTDRLANEGYNVDVAMEGKSGFEKALRNNYDLIILDIMLPDKNGFDVCRDLRKEDNETPVIMLTAKDQVVDKVLGLKLGADDYVSKPFETIELVARIEANLRRHHSTSGKSMTSYRFGDVSVDFKRGEILKGGKKITLSAKEFYLLQYFVEHEGMVLSRDQLLNKVWGYEAMPTTRTVDVHILWLRQKLEDDPSHPQYFKTVHGRGYKFTGT